MRPSHLFRGPATVCSLLLFLGACGQNSSPSALGAADTLELALEGGVWTVFDNAPENGFTDASWGGSHTLQSTTYTHTGTYAASFQPNNWNGIQFDHAAFAASGYSALTFWVNGGAASGQELWAGVTDPKNNQYRKSIDTYLASGKVVANQWQQLTLPLADIGASAIQIASVYIMAGSARAQPAVYIDDVALLSATTGSSTGSNGHPNPPAGSTGGSTTTTTGAGTTSGTTTGSGTTTAGGTTSSTTTGGGTTSTTGGTSTGGTATVARESWAWVYTNWTASLAAIAANVTAFTHISPTFYSLNYNYTSGVAHYANCSTASGTYNCTNAGTNNFSGLTTQQFTQQVTAMGLATVPAIYAGAENSGTDTGVQNILNNTNGAATNFISAMVQEAVTNGYAGYNLDWEMGTGVDATYASKFVSFVNTFKQALSPHGMSLSVDVIVSNINGTWCSSNNGYLDFTKLATSSIDRIIIEDYTSYLGTAYASCQPAPLSSTSPASCPLNSAGTIVAATGLLNFMCSNLPANMVVIGLESYSSGSNPIAGQMISAMESYGIHKVAVWPQLEGSYPFLSAQGLVASQSNWYSLLQSFLAQ